MRKFIPLSSLCVLACASTSPSPAPDAGSPPHNPPPPTSTADAGMEAATETPPSLNGCTTYVDMTASGATIQGPTNAVPSQFSPNCVHIRAGQSVTWNVDFTNHPLAASGGDTPSPIATTATGTSVTFAFPTAGAFGFHCLAHPTIMFGAVWVTP